MNRPLRVGIAALVLAAAAVAAPIISYQGVVTVHGTPITGTGYFKFALLDGNDHVVWTHDGSPPGSPPAGWLELPVSRGLFQVPLGDTNVLGMTAPIPAAALHTPPIRLRTWFSTNTTSFSLLSPDVPLNVPDWSVFDSGALLVVDVGGRGDFSSLNAAMNYVAASAWIQTVWLMPGHYELSSTVEMPSNRWVVVRGFDEGSVTIRRAGGPALRLGSGRLVHLQITGSPAATDAGGGTNVYVELADCRLSGEGTAAALALSGTGTVVVARNVLFESEAGVAAQLQGRVWLSARDCRFDVGGGGAGIRLGGAAGAQIVDSTLSAESGRAVVLGGTEDLAWFEAANSVLRGGIVRSNSLGGAILRLCTVSADEANGAAVSVTGAGAWNETRLEQCVVDAVRVPAVAVATPAGRTANLVLRDSRIRSFELPAEEAVVVATNANAGAVGLELDVRGCEIADMSSEDTVRAVQLHGAEFHSFGTEIRGGIGIEAGAHSEVSLRMSAVDARTTAVWLRSGSEGSASSCDIIGGTDEADGAGVWAEAGTMAVLINSWAEGQGRGAGAIGIRCAAQGSDGATVFVVGGGVMGDARAVLVEGGVCFAGNATFLTMAGIPLEVRRTTANPDAEFHSCQIMRLTEAPTPAVLLSGLPAPVPRLVGCSLSAPGASASVSLHTAVNGQIGLINSVLSTNLGPGVMIVPATSLGQGNYIP